MKPFKAQRIGNLLHNRELMHLEHKITQLRAINQSLQNILPPEYRDLCEVANYEQPQLVIATSSQAAATRLNFMLPMLVKAMQAAGYTTMTRAKLIITPNKQPDKPYWQANPADEKILEQLKKRCHEQ